MSTLASNITPFEALSTKKPDLSHLCVWGCQCFVTIPTELHTKAGPHRFEAIFVGYEKARVRWMVHNLKEKIHFSHDVIFNEDLSNCLSIPRSITPTTPPSINLPTCPIHDRILTAAGRDYNEVIKLKELHRLEHVKGTNGGAQGDDDLSTDGGAELVDDLGMNGGAIESTSTNGGAVVDINNHDDGGAEMQRVY
jgi:hypothetical protein